MILQLSADGIQCGGRKIARCIAGVLRDGSQCFFRLLKLQQCIHPTGCRVGRDHLIVGAIEKLTRADAGEAPDLAGAAFAGFQTFDQRFTEVCFRLHGQQFQACRGAPHFPQQAIVHPLFLKPARKECGR